MEEPMRRPMVECDFEYARFISPTEIAVPTQDDFPGVQNWRHDDSLMRSKGFYPVLFVEDPPAPDPGFVIEPTGFELHYSPVTIIGPVIRTRTTTMKLPNGRTTRRKVMEPANVEIHQDTSFIEVTDFDYVPITPDMGLED